MKRDPLPLGWQTSEPRNERESAAQLEQGVARNRQRLPRRRPPPSRSLNAWGLASLAGIALGWPIVWGAWKLAQWLWSFV